MKKISLILILSALILFSGGCGKDDGASSSGGKDVKEIVFFSMQLRPTFDDYFLPIFEEFEKTHPGVKIRWMDYPADNYETKIITSFMGDNAPDVINLTPLMLPKFVNRGLVAPLDELLSREVLDSYFQNVLEDACQLEGKTYAVPWYLAAVVTMVNMAVFEEAGLTEDDIPSTYEELYGVAETIRDETDKYAFFPIYTEGGALRGHLITGGVTIFNEGETEAIFNTPRGVEVAKYWADFYKENLAPSEALTAMHRLPIEYFKSGRLGIFHSGPQFLKHVKSDAPDIYKNTVVRPALHWKDNEVYFIDVHNLVVSSRSKHPKLAAEFAAYVTNAENQLAFAKLTTIIPSVKNAVEDPYFTDLEDTPEGQARKISASQVKKGKVMRNPVRHSGALTRVFDQTAEKLCLGELTAEEAMKEAEEKCNEILKE